MDLSQLKIGVIGLGYVGLPLAVEFGKKHTTVGFDISHSRVRELEGGNDSTLEVTGDDLIAATRLSYSTDIESLRDCNFYIVTVPTPINEAKQPDLSPLVGASRSIGKVLSDGDYVVYESTVYPGATEEVCAPILERESGLSYLHSATVKPDRPGFFLGYSPERINPGDKKHTVTQILKVTSGSTPEAADFIDAVYRDVIVAGTHRAPNIRVAEAAKVIENTQRDVNIALINELAMLFDRLDIDTEAVLKAAGTKWNFLPFRPGLVGGHCIGVDPYYLTHKAQSVGHHPEMILAGRRINDGMGAHVSTKLVKGMIRKGITVAGARVLIMGLTFKENCPDLRNTRVVDIVAELKEYGVEPDVYDPWVNASEANEVYGIEPIAEPQAKHYDAIVVAVGHRQFLDMGIERIRALGRSPAVIFDVKYLFPAEAVDIRL